MIALSAHKDPVLSTGASAFPGTDMPTKKKPLAQRSARKRSLRALTPREFEHLIFDLIISCGMNNVVWRTPGADGGRDIEGVTFDQDLSGLQTTKKWFVECKRYSTSVDWPTIYEKVSYADSLGADILLLCTTSQFSPVAITHVASWNDAHRSLAIRLWPLHEIEQRLQQYPDLQLKYGLSNAPSTPGRSLLQLALALSKTVSTNYSNLVFKGAATDPMLNASQALSDLLLRRMEDIERTGRINPTFPSATPTSLTNCQFVGNTLHIDEPGFIAFVAYLVALKRKPLKIEQLSDGSCRIVAKYNLKEIIQRYRPTFDAIAIWADFEFHFSQEIVHLRQRQ